MPSVALVSGNGGILSTHSTLVLSNRTGVRRETASDDTSAEMSAYTKPVPAITPEMRPFFDAAKRHELVVQRCTHCGTHRFPGARDLLELPVDATPTGCR